MSRPSSKTLPLDGLSKPAMTRRLVVLPQPDGPSSVMNSPLIMSRSTASSPTMPPGKTFETACNRTSGSGAIANLGGFCGVDPEDLALLGTGIAEGMQKRALEGKAVAGLQPVFGRIHHQFDLARKDIAEFMAGMGIGFRRAAIGLDRHQHAGERRARRRQQRLGD